MYGKVVIFLGQVKHYEGTVWKAGARWRFLSTAERVAELAKCWGPNWEG